MKNIINNLQLFLEKIDSYRDKILFVFIKPYWPRRIMPNHITYIRLAIGVLLFILLFFFSIEDKTLIISLFIAGVLTDFFGKTKMVMLSVVFAVILIIWPRLPSQLFVYILWATIPFSFLSIFTKVLELNAKGHIKNKTVAKQLNNYENI